MGNTMRILRVLSGLLFLLACSIANAGEEGGHAHHHHAQHEVRVSSADYVIPDVRLLRDDGRRVALADELNDGRSVLMSFIYTDCTAVCPLVSRTLSQFQERLGERKGEVHIVSISIDPEQDTPSRLLEYAQRYGAGATWQHYTGTVAASVVVQRAFDVYHGDKMNHTPVFFLRKAPGASWLRVDGFIAAEELFEKYQGLDH